MVALRNNFIYIQLYTYIKYNKMRRTATSCDKKKKGKNENDFKNETKHLLTLDTTGQHKTPCWDYWKFSHILSH